MKEKLKPVGVFLAIVLAGGLIFLIVHFLAGNYLTSESDKSAATKCEGSHPSHHVVIENNSVNPVHTAAGLCDTLTITNSDNRIRLVAFGEHDKHQTYDGITEKALKQNESFTVELNQAGTYIFHDHYQDEAQGTFTVAD